MSKYKTVVMMSALLVIFSTIVFSQGNVSQSERNRTRMQEKLQRIVIPELNYQDANIEDIIKDLHQASIKYDKDSIPGEKGVDFLLQLKGPGTSAVKVPKITMSLRDIPLMDAIKYISDIVGLKYHIEGRTVIIHRPDIVVGELKTRTYKVLPEIIEVITGGSGGVVLNVERVDVKKSFIDVGIPFPEGTSIVYQPSLNKLIVKNTAENLELVESLLKKMEEATKQDEEKTRADKKKMVTMTPEELLAAQEEVRSQAKETEGLKTLDMAYQAMSRREFDVALKYFSQAMAMMPLRPHTVETRQKAMMSEAECEYRLALNYYQDGKYQKAKDAIQRALEYSPGHRGAQRLSERIRLDESRDQSGK